MVSLENSRSLAVRFILNTFEALFPGWTDKKSWLDLALTAAEQDGDLVHRSDGKTVTALGVDLSAIDRRVLWISIE